MKCDSRPTCPCSICADIREEVAAGGEMNLLAKNFLHFLEANNIREVTSEQLEAEGWVRI